MSSSRLVRSGRCLALFGVFLGLHSTSGISQTIVDWYGVPNFSPPQALTPQAPQSRGLFSDSSYMVEPAYIVIVPQMGPPIDPRGPAPPAPPPPPTPPMQVMPVQPRGLFQLRTADLFDRPRVGDYGRQSFRPDTYPTLPDVTRSLGNSVAEPVPAKDFTARLTIPLLFTTTAVSNITGTTVGNTGDWHTLPEATLSWSHVYDTRKLSAEASLGTDRYKEFTDVNSDFASFSASAAFGEHSGAILKPYVRYTGTFLYLPTFRSLETQFHDLAAGFTAGIGFRNGLGLDYDRSGDPGDLSIKLDVRGGKRFSDISDYELRFAYGRAVFAYTLSKEWRLEGVPKFNARWYDNYFGLKRTDYRPGADLSAIWTPEWLKRLGRYSELSLNMNIARNYSNVPEAAYRLWEAGPTLELRYKF